MLNTDMTRLKLVVLLTPKDSDSSAQILLLQTKGERKGSCEQGIAQLAPGSWSGIWPVVGIRINHLIWRAVEAIIRAILPEFSSIEIRRRDAKQGKQGNGDGEL